MQVKVSRRLIAGAEISAGEHYLEKYRFVADLRAATNFCNMRSISQKHFAQRVAPVRKKARTKHDDPIQSGKSGKLAPPTNL